MSRGRGGWVIAWITLGAAAILVALHFFDIGGSIRAPGAPGAIPSASRRGRHRTGEPRTARRPAAIGGAIAGRVVYAATGRPARGADVRLLGAPGGPLSTESDSHGLFEFRGLPEEDDDEVVVRAPGYATVDRRGFAVVPGSEADAGTFLLGPPVELRVLVHDPSGEPIAGADVRVFSRLPRLGDDLDPQGLPSTPPSVPHPIARTAADAAGSAEFHSLAPGGYGVAATAAGRERAAKPVELVAGEGSASVSLTLGKAYSLSGMVTDENGAPVKGTIAAEPVDLYQADFRYQGQRVPIDPLGRYRFDHLLPRNWCLVVYPAGRAAVKAGEVAVPDVKRFDVRLSRGARIRGTVRDEKGRPVAGARVRVLSATDLFVRDGTSVVTDAEGRYELGGLSPRSFRGIEVTKAGYARYPPPSFESRPPPSPTNGVIRWDVTLHRGIELAGVVTRKSDGRPVAGARVRAVAMEESGDELSFETAVTDENGRYDLRGLPPWEYRLYVDAAGYVQAAPLGHSGRWTVVLHGGKRKVEKDLFVVRGWVVTGRVLRSDGMPAAGVPVSQNADDSVGGVTANDGTFRLMGAWPARGVCVYVPGTRAESAPFDLSAGSTVRGVVVRLRPPATVSGVVTMSDGSSPGGGRVFVFSNQSLSDFGGDSGFESFQSVAGRPVGANGDFSARLDLGKPRKMRAFAYVPGHRLAASAPFTVGPGGSVTGIRIDVPTGLRLTGKIIDSSGVPMGEVLVHLSPDDSDFLSAQHSGGGHENEPYPPTTEVTTGADGTFSFPGLVGGQKYVLQAEKDGYGFVERHEKVSRDTNVEITLVRGGTISGRVVDDAGAPVARLIVRISSPEGWSLKSVTDSNGVFEFSGLANAAYVLKVSPTDRVERVRSDERLFGLYRVAPCLPVTLNGIRPDGDPIRIRVHRGLSLSGRVVGTGGAAVFDARVQVVQTGASGEQIVRHATTDASGRFSVSGLSEGDVVVAVARLQRYQSVQFHAQAGTSGLTITLEPAHSIEGRVLDPTGAPASGIRVSIQNWPPQEFEAQEPVGHCLTDALGRFTFSDLDPHDYLITVGGNHRFAHAIKEVGAGSVRVAIRLQPAR